MQLPSTGVSRETPQGGGGFIFASLKLNQEKTTNLESSFHRLRVKFIAETKSQGRTRENPQRVGVLFSLAFSISRETPVPFFWASWPNIGNSHFLFRNIVFLYTYHESARQPAIYIFGI